MTWINKKDEALAKEFQRDYRRVMTGGIFLSTLVTTGAVFIPQAMGYAPQSPYLITGLNVTLVALGAINNFLTGTHSVGFLKSDTSSQITIRSKFGFDLIAKYIVCKGNRMQENATIERNQFIDQLTQIKKNQHYLIQAYENLGLGEATNEVFFNFSNALDVTLERLLIEDLD